MAQKKKNEPKNNSFHTLNYLMKIDQSIRNGEYPNANKLNKILGTQFSRSTFGRYIRTLQDDYGAPVEFDFKKKTISCPYPEGELKYKGRIIYGVSKMKKDTVIVNGHRHLFNHMEIIKKIKY